MEPIKTIGQVLDATAERDAIHVAILPVIAAASLWRNTPLRLVYGTTNKVLCAHQLTDTNCIGILDPFLPGGIQEGVRAWCFLKPGSIVGLRHHWTHPEIDAAPAMQSPAEQWLRAFACRWNFDYEEMLADAIEGCVTARGIDLHGRDELAAGDEALFWHNIQIVTGKTFDEDHRKNFSWSCSC